DAGADRGGLGPGPVVHSAGGARLRLHRQGDNRSGAGADRRGHPQLRRRTMTDLHVPASASFQPVHNRYIVPSFVERTSYGIKESNPYNKLFEERIIFLGVQIDDASANDVMAQLLTLEGTDPD